MPKRTPSEVWKKLVDEAGEEEIERAASVSVEQAEKELAEAGFDVAAERATANAFLESLERGELPVAAPAPAPAPASAPAPAPAPAPASAPAPESAPALAVPQDPPSRPARPERRPLPPVVWLAAAATVTVGGALLYAALHQTPAPPPPTPEPQPSTPVPAPVDSAPPDLVAAASLRRKAAAACDDRQWDACLAYLDHARAIDPAGDESPEAKAIRDRATKGKDLKK